MSFDSYIFLGILIMTVIMGLYSSKNIKTIKEYAIGNRDFSTVVLVCTIVATWLSGDDFFIFISESYSHGLYFIFACVFGGLILFLLLGMFFIPRMNEFLGALSIAEAMGNLYGNKVRSIVAISGCIGTSGVIAAQLKVSGLLFEYSLNIPSFYGIVTAGLIVTIYATFGGIKSVTFTDVIQLFTFGTVIPIIAFFILETLPTVDSFLINLKNNELFDYKKVLDFSSKKSLYYLFLFFYVVVPSFDPTIFQRISMAKNIWQARKSFIIAAFVIFTLNALMSWVGVVMLTAYPNIEPNNVVKHIIMDYSYIGFSGLALAGVMAMVMSTTDSYINSSAILVIHDFFYSLGIKVKNELTASRITSFIIGIFSIFLALKSNNLLELIITTSSFYMPIVTIPFMFAILGFRTTTKAVLIGMGAAFITVIFWELFMRNDFIDSIVPGMVSNIIFLVGSHYLFKQQGGWIGIKDDIPVKILQQRRKLLIKYFIQSVSNFNIKTFLRQNKPRQESICIYLGIFSIISVYTTIYTIPYHLKSSNQYLLNFIYLSVFIISTILISYPLWTPTFKRSIVMPIIWNIALFYILICVGCIQVIISNLGQFQLMMFLLSVVILSTLVRWQISLIFTLIGTLFSIIFFRLYIQEEIIINNNGTVQFEVLYVLLLLSSILIAFFKPKQEFQEKTEQKSDYLSHKLDDQTIALKKSLELKQEFLRNLEHEARTPITSISTMGSILDESYDKLSEKQRRKAIKDIAKSSERLNSLISNILDLSKLSGLNYQLNITDIDFSELVYERVKICRKLYTEDKYKDLQEITLDINDNIIVSCDQNYITTAIDNIVINSLQYCTDGKITIILYKNEQKEVVFKVQDEGIGIPKEELYDVFGAFTVSSKTKTPAGGRGVGLALSKKVVDLHNGRIWAKQNSDKGVTVGFNLPLKN
jgi:Na+/proline symporter/signal transduction histidine kinase